MSHATDLRVQNEVMYWHNLAYQDRTLTQVGKKLLEEASECHIETREYDRSVIKGTAKTIEECADVAICAYVIAGMLGEDLDMAIKRKLIILNSRVHQQKERDAARGLT